MNKSAFVALLFGVCATVSAADPELSGHWTYQPLWGDDRLEISFSSEDKEFVIQQGHVGEIVDSCADEIYSLCFTSGTLVIAIPKSRVGEGDNWSIYSARYVVRAAGIDLKILGKVIKDISVIEATWVLDAQHQVPDRRFEILYSNEEGLIGYMEVFDEGRGRFYLSSDENPLGGSR